MEQSKGESSAGEMELDLPAIVFFARFSPRFSFFLPLSFLPCSVAYTSLLLFFFFFFFFFFCVYKIYIYIASYRRSIPCSLSPPLVFPWPIALGE